jgi:hypothetical protein
VIDAGLYDGEGLYSAMFREEDRDTLICKINLFGVHWFRGRLVFILIRDDRPSSHTSFAQS